VPEGEEVKEHYAVYRRGSVWEGWTADPDGQNKRRVASFTTKIDALAWYDAAKDAAGWKPGELPREIR
jgi:hypothetical protein